MAEFHIPTVLIVGAGSMGLVMGYHLVLAGAQITFLVRPSRAQALEQPRILYSFDENKVKEYTNYTYTTRPSEILDKNFDFIIITLDGASLQNEEGMGLIATVGQAARATTTKVIVGSVFLHARDWFLDHSCLSGDQVSSAGLGTVAYSGKKAKLPIHPPADADLVKKADVAYIYSMGNGLTIEDYVPSISSSISGLYNACGVSSCVIWSPTQTALTIYPMFAVFAGFELLDWPEFKDIDITSEPWKLTTAAAREIQVMGLYGDAGIQTAQATSEESLLQAFIHLGESLRPLDFRAFKQYYHGGKVNGQDPLHIQRCISEGMAQGRSVAALKTLVNRIKERVL